MGDPGIIFGRCGQRSASIRAKVKTSIKRDDRYIPVDTDLSSLSYPTLLHIGAETVRAAGFSH